jgi:hypothetical protein
MPIAAALPILTAQIQSAQNMGIAGSPDLISFIIASTLASVAPMGLIMAGLGLIPLVTAGVSATQTILKSSYDTGIAGSPSLTSQIIASAVAALCPLVPPTGITLLKTLLESIDNLNIAGKNELTSQMQASAIVAYFTAGLVI